MNRDEFMENAPASWDAVWRRQDAAAAHSKRTQLEAALEECLEYFEDRYDVVDGDDGEPRANREMQLGQMIESALGRRP